MTEEVQEENKLYEVQEIKDMFNTAFLPMVRELCSRKKAADADGSEYIGYQISISFLFPEDIEELDYDKLQKMSFNLMPLVKKPESEEVSEEENAEKDS